MTTNDVGYELNIVTASDAQADPASNPDTVTHASNRTIDQKLLSCWTIGEVSVLHPPVNSSFSAI